jgi:hypothetical protein
MGVFIGSGVLYQYLKVHWTMNIYFALSLVMGLVFFLMNIWPGFLLKPKLEDSVQTGYPT